MAAGTTPKPRIFLSYLNRLLKIQPWERSEVGQLLALKFQEVPRYGGAEPGPQQPLRCRCFPDPAGSKRLHPAPGTRPPAPPPRQRFVLSLLRRRSSGSRRRRPDGGMLRALSSEDKGTCRHNFQRGMQIPYGRGSLHRGQVKAGPIRAIGDNRSLMEVAGWDNPGPSPAWGSL